ncbi:MAG TPA: DNA recombination protein RmuC [Dehalococcoidia bacterium]|nr:DNA recombination protein RmuC [Dehalococcoidia bacterium]
MILLAIFLGLVLGALAGAWGATTVVRARGERERADLASRSAADIAATGARIEECAKRVGQLEGEIALLRDELARTRAEAASAQAAEARLTAELEAERRAAAASLEVLRTAEAKFRETFEALSADALRRNNTSFLELAKEALGQYQQAASGELQQRQAAIDDLVRPIRESLEKVDTKLQDVEKSRVEAYAALREQVRSLNSAQQQLQSETANLVKALRMPAVRGRWGEIQLRRVVEMAGMVEHCDFEEQRTAETEDGRVRPDVVVRLPGGKHVVVDAKAPLMSYLQAVEASDDGERDAMLRDHVRQVREHVTRLGSKAYWSQFQPAPEFVVMFLPGESLFSAALQHDPVLIEDAIAQGVLIAGPTTLISLLRSAAYGWRQEQIAENAQQISGLGRELYDRLQTMAGHFEDMRRALDRTVDAYNRAVGSFESRVLVAGRRFRELGATNQPELAQLAGVERAPRALHAPVDIDSPPAFLTEPETAAAE